MLKLKDVARCVLLAVCDLSGDQHFGPVGFVLRCDFLCWCYSVGQCTYELGTCSLVGLFLLFIYLYCRYFPRVLF